MTAIVKILIMESATLHLPDEALDHEDGLGAWVEDRIEFSWGGLEVLDTKTEEWFAEVHPMDSDEPASGLKPEEHPPRRC